MMKSLLYTALSVQSVVAFPAVLDMLGAETLAPRQAGCSTSKLCQRKYDVSNAQIGYDPSNPTAAQKISANRNNGGGICQITTFDESQLISTSGQHAYKNPGKSDIRGPCPGLNAAANHGYLPRNGVASISQTITGLGALYGMSVELSGFLAAYAVALDGDIVSGAWSIGGPASGVGLPLAGSGQGISWSHNKYEGDSSIARCDAYLNGGDAHSLSTTRFAYAYEAGLDGDLYTMDRFSQAFTKNTIRSEATNPLYFAPLFSTTLVSPAAYNFVVAFMSNHTAANPAGYLNGAIFKEFFGVSGDYPNFTWNKGKERIPNNWYRRPLSQPYTATGGVFGDLAFEFAAYPKSFRFGGNTNGVNTYTGIDLANFTNGVYNAQNLFTPNNLACFLYQNIQQGLPDVLTTGFSTDVANFLSPYLNKAFGDLTCPQVSKFNDNNLPPYPGRSYSPNGPATNC